MKGSQNEMKGSQNEMKGSQDEMKGTLAEIKGQLTVVEGKVELLAKRQADSARAFAKSFNFHESHMPETVLQIVPFPDGQYPSDSGLPVLDTIASIEHLTTHERNEYLGHYYPGQIIRGSVAERKKLLLCALGCKISI
ncbi:hypothetical protein M422DRAFT_29804 [Sphaerobolus stellatus SS14]|uniref:Mug135-like C-terminal domain-containing protein n=1 Tax=Sphaerobolus stellatus (strain SS14) TaxID=990650 RepID=A0A0C9VT50_SPHS4|nr:hypothetical protein M422DRAFT_29804 [Sphaerobolus stellatus SS14]